MEVEALDPVAVEEQVPSGAVRNFDLLIETLMSETLATHPSKQLLNLSLTLFVQVGVVEA